MVTSFSGLQARGRLRLQGVNMHKAPTVVRRGEKWGVMGRMRHQS